MNKRPNIVLFVADQMRCDALAHMGNPAAVTPNLDALLTEGVSYRHAYCQNPVCVPSRLSFLTGRYPHTTGHRTMHYLQEEGEPNILKTMKAAGYEVVWVGRNDVVPAGRSKAEYCDEYYNGVDMDDQKDSTFSGMRFAGGKRDAQTPEFMEQDQFYSFYLGKLDAGQAQDSHDWRCLASALDYLERKKERADDKPFFLYVTLTFPHPPYACEEPWYTGIDRETLLPRRPDVEKLNQKPSMLHGIRSRQGLQNWTEKQYNELRATYLAMVSRFDFQFGELCAKLKEGGFYDNTSVFVFSDHGDYTGDYGITEKVQNCFEDPIANVPLIVKPAAGIPVQPGISEALAELVDLPVTFARMAGIELDYTQFGKPLMDSLAGAPAHKDAVFCEGGRIHGEVQAMEGGHGPDSPYWPRLASQESEGPEHTKAVMIRMGDLKYVMRLYETDELYDLKKDPLELDNCIGNPDYKEQVSALKERLLRFMVETGDCVPVRRDQR